MAVSFNQLAKIITVRAGWTSHITSGALSAEASLNADHAFSARPEQPGRPIFRGEFDRPSSVPPFLSHREGFGKDHADRVAQEPGRHLCGEGDVKVSAGFCGTP
jgi:hypothetical protein